MLAVKKMRKYELPGFLEGIVLQKDYERWLHRKAVAHVRRDRSRGNKTATNEEYKTAIHNAVQESCGVDVYTGERLAWDQIGKYNNEKSEKLKREYKKQFALLPSVDHVGDGTGSADFKICAWRTNDAKSDLTYDEFVELCRKVLEAANKPVHPTR